MRAARPGRQLLRNQVVRRLPTAQELARRRPLALTRRDQAILAALAQHGFLSADVVEIAYFSNGALPPCPGDSRAHRRLRLLWLWGLVERLELPVSRVLGGRRAFVYTLTKEGAAHAAVALGVAPRAIGLARLDRRDPGLGEHDRQVALCWARLRELARAAGVGPCRWTAEPALRARRLRVRDPDRGTSWQVVPDGYAEIDYPDGTVQCCMLEVDMGTVGLAHFGRKLRGLERLLEQGLFEREWGRRTFEVLVLTSSEERLEHLWRVGRRAVPSAAWPWYSFATVDVLDGPAQFGGRAWRTLRGDYNGLLYDRARRAACTGT